MTATLGQVYRTNDVLVLIHVATAHDREPVQILKSQRSVVALSYSNTLGTDFENLYRRKSSLARGARRAPGRGTPTADSGGRALRRHGRCWRSSRLYAKSTGCRTYQPWGTGRCRRASAMAHILKSHFLYIQCHLSC